MNYLRTIARVAAAARPEELRCWGIMRAVRLPFPTIQDESARKLAGPVRRALRRRAAQSRPSDSAVGRVNARAHLPPLRGARTVFVDRDDAALRELRTPRAPPRRKSYALRAYLCGTCFLVQLEALVAPAEIFTEYAYFSSYSTSWVEHARRYADMAVARLGLDTRSLVVEVGSNDGYLLQRFVARGIPVRRRPAGNVPRRRGRNACHAVALVGESWRASGERGTSRDLIAPNQLLANCPPARFRLRDRAAAQAASRHHRGPTPHAALAGPVDSLP